MKLTPDLIEGAFQFINNATRDRELDLRDYKIPAIENLGATLDQFDCIDFTDNDIRRLENFPLLPRLKRLYLSNNRVSKIDDRLHECLPNLEGILLINNQIQELGDLQPLVKLTKLEMLALMGNPVQAKKHYRLYLIHQIPSLRLLDFRKIKLKERNEAKKLFSGAEGKRLATTLGVRSTPTDGSGGGKDGAEETAKVAASLRARLTPEEMDSIRKAINKASSLAEIERLTAMLQSGYRTGRLDLNGTSGSSGDSGGDSGGMDMDTSN